MALGKDEFGKSSESNRLQLEDLGIRMMDRSRSDGVVDILKKIMETIHGTKFGNF